ncbi:MAG: hypothetical protein K2X11_15610, partial [Acetobacteraceae bacterium]|nr:hypothetical protein [Acetobacteraceae bacterium]
MPVDAWFPTKGKGRYRADQAILAAACLFLAGCEVPARADLRAIARDVSGASLAARLPPPGLDGPNPHLGLVPPRPERPDASFRSNVTRALEADRSRAQEPLAPRDRPAPPAAAEA